MKWMEKYYSRMDGEILFENQDSTQSCSWSRDGRRDVLLRLENEIWLRVEMEEEILVEMRDQSRKKKN